MPALAARLARSMFRSPRLRESSELTPTAMPLTAAIMKFWTGKAIETAVRAASLTPCDEKTVDDVVQRLYQHRKDHREAH